MLRLILQLLSFLTGQRLFTPDESARQLSHISDLNEKLRATEKMNIALRSELHQQAIRAENAATAMQTKHQEESDKARQEILSLRALLAQQSINLDRETLRHIQENEALMNQLNWLSGTIAHDFRAPLRAIDAYSFFLADDLGNSAPPEANRSLEEIRRNGKRMGILIDGLIEFLRMSVCPLNIQLHGFEETIQQVINEHFDFSPVPIEVDVYGTGRFDRALGMRVFKELIGNAVKFSTGVPNAKVIVRQVSPTEIEIVDNGVGFSDEHTGQKFQLFHRMHGNDEFEGEGIGLAVAQRIAARHHWTLSLDRVGLQTVASLRWEAEHR